MSTAFRFTRPTELTLIAKPTLSVAVVIACRDGQEKLDLVLASLAAQSYPVRLMNIYIIDDGSSTPITIPAISPKNTRIVKYKNSPAHWGKTAATNHVASGLKEDVLWFIDADMVFEPHHLAHHMKWHHEADDFAVLGWKRFVDHWDYTPTSLLKSLQKGDFHNLHSQSWSKELWEKRLIRTQDLLNPALDGYRTFVGATFSIMNSQWRKLGGYNSELVTGEDTELGWRIFANGLRTLPEREAHSWHLGFSTVEQHKESIHRHNDPALAQFIPEMKTIRSRYDFDWKVPTYEVVVDVRKSTLSDLLARRAELLEAKGTSAHFTLLAPWKQLKNRYSPTSDSHANLREIHSWLKADEDYEFREIAPEDNLTIDNIIELFHPSSTPYYLFIDGQMAIDLKYLADYQLSQGFGLVGVVDKEDNRTFSIFGPALARACDTDGWIYQNISTQWGICWMTDDKFIQINAGRKSRVKRFIRFTKREGKKIDSPTQLLIFIKKLLKLVLRKLFRNG